MSFKRKIALTVLALSCVFASAFAGCKIGEMTGDEYLENNGAAGQCVTYFANGGRFNDNEIRTVLNLYYKPDSYIISAPTPNFRVARTDYTFDAWYYVEVDGDGNPVTDGEGNPVLGERVQATDKIGRNEHKYVVANWNANVAMEIYLVTDGDFAVTDAENNTYVSGQLIKTQNFGTTSNYGLSESDGIAGATNATYLYFYSDEECTVPIREVARPAEGVTENIKLYVKYIEGDWEIVSTSREARNMLARTAEAANYYLFTPDGSNVINCADERAINMNTGDFAINIEGNGVIIDNMSFSGNLQNGATAAVLGRFAEGAAIKNLTLRNVNVTVSVAPRASVNVYLVCSGIANGALFEAFEVLNATMNVNMPGNAMIYNIQQSEDNFESNNWIFGGYDSDEEFLSAVGGISVSGGRLIVNDKSVVEN